ncbi:STAS domain-containing protein [Aureimonas sp. SK2]|uniref:STAS domain-containing protein n=1 Tax=Aureimonas sp. SK2 TaxID=3015992 RepID=UPI0024437790|nr:STAS domain-containing protein [Aureimonas sp. SK2]
MFVYLYTIQLEQRELRRLLERPSQWARKLDEGAQEAMMMQELLPEGEMGDFAAPSEATHGEVTLSPVLDVRAAKPLHAELLAARGDTIIVDASNVERIGAQCAAVLLSAARSWDHDGQEFSLVKPSAGFIKGLELMGIGLNELGGEPTD